MKNKATFLIVMLILSVMSGQAQVIPFSSERWNIMAQEHSLETYKGQECLLMKGGIAYLDDVDFLNGMLEFDLAIPNARGFMGGVWRLQNEKNYEEFYLRSHQSGNPDACQYTPVFNGVAGWQLYYGEGYGAPVRHRFDEWMHIRIVVSGDKGEVFIDDMELPAVLISDMKRDIASGKIGVEVNNFSPARIANFQYTQMEFPELIGKSKEEITNVPGMITSWQVSSPFDEEILDGTTELSEDPGQNYRVVNCEQSGTINLASVADIMEGNTVAVKIAIHSESDQLKQLDFGYSDRVRVYINGRAIYSGNNNYMSRDYRYLGTIGFFDTVYLPLKEGENILMLAVSESFGGWGLKAKFPDAH